MSPGEALRRIQIIEGLQILQEKRWTWLGQDENSHSDQYFVDIFNFK